MKRVDIFCSSQAATSICLSMEQISASPSPSTTTLLLGGGGGGGGGRVIDRHNPILRDSKRTTTPKVPTSSSKPQKPHPKPKKTSSKLPNSDENENHPSKTDTTAAAAIGKKRWSCTNPGDFLSPPGSTRYLLREKVYYNSVVSSDSDPTLQESSTSDKEPTPPSDSPLEEVEVVLRVSLHCRGCEKKLRKHLSRMEGVKSFDIDFPAKKVTVTGNVTASELVLTVSKLMKNAQLWSPPISSSNPTSEENSIATL